MVPLPSTRIQVWLAATPAEDVDAIRAAFHGRPTFEQSQRVTDWVTRTILGTSPRKPLLSPQELRVLVFISLGFRYKEIAEAMHLSPHTVRYYRTRLIRKLGARTQAQAVAIWVRAAMRDEAM